MLRTIGSIETSSGRIMHFNVTQPKSQIIKTAKSLIYRILTISDKQFHTKYTKISNEILTNNSFPKTLTLQLIEDTIRKMKNKMTNNSTKN